jgi:hypothetical protein
MEMFTAVYTSPDPDSVAVFWGAFASDLEARKAVAEFVATRPYWAIEDFTFSAHVFGAML